MLAISPRLTLLALVPLVLVSWLVRHFGRQVHDRYEEVQAQLAEMNALVQENLAGARVVRAYAQEADEEARFAEANEEYVARNRRLVRITGILHPGIGFLMGLGSLTVLWLGGRMVVAGEITLGEFVAFGVYLAMLHWPMIALGWVVNLFERGEASMGRIARDPGRAARDPRPTRRSRSRDPRRRRVPRAELRLRRRAGAARRRPARPGGHHRGDRGPDRLRQEHARLAPAAALDAPPGTLFVDGHDVRALPLATLRGAIGFVPQESFLFSATLRENVAFGCAKRARRASAARAPVGGGASRSSTKDVPGLPAGLRDHGGRARHHALGRAEAAHGARARAGDRPAHPGARRRALGGRHRDRGARSSRACAR